MEKIRKNSNEFETIRKTSWLKIRNSIRFEGKIIRFVRFEKFSIRLIRKYIFNSKNSRKINSKFVRFDSTPPLYPIWILGWVTLKKAVLLGWNFNNKKKILSQIIPSKCLRFCQSFSLMRIELKFTPLLPTKKNLEMCWNLQH